MKKIILALIILLLLIAIPLTVYIVSQQQELRKKAAPATTLTLTPATVTKKVGDVFPLEVIVDTGENQVVAAEVHLVFDPSKLEAQTITNSSLFPSILTSGVVERGAASITVGAPDIKKPVRGTGTVAVVRLKALEKTEVPVSVRFSPTTFVGGLGEGATNVLVGTTPATIVVTDDTSLSPGGSDTSLIPATPSATFQATTLTPTPTLSATQGGEASGAAIHIAAPLPASTASSSTPTIRGTATPNSVVTITIYSTPQTVVVQADRNGNWSYTPTAPLPSGSHNIVASTTDATGKTQVVTTSFVIAAGASQGATESATIIATQSAIPISGTTSLTYTMILAGTVLILIGFFYPLSVR